MSERTQTERLEDIRQSIERIVRYLGDMSHEDFEQDEKTQDAVIRNIEIIGEAAKGISEHTRKRNPALPWTQMAGSRDRLIHHYFGVNLDIVWQIARVELPAVLSSLDDVDLGEERGG